MFFPGRNRIIPIRLSQNPYMRFPGIAFETQTRTVTRTRDHFQFSRHKITRAKRLLGTKARRFRRRNTCRLQQLCLRSSILMQCIVWNRDLCMRSGRNNLRTAERTPGSSQTARKATATGGAVSFEINEHSTRAAEKWPRNCHNARENFDGTKTNFTLLASTPFNTTRQLDRQQERAAEGADAQSNC